MKVGKWSTTAGNNNATPPDGWPENQAPSTVNDCAREMMASIRTLVQDIQYIDLDNTPSMLTATTFSLAAADTTTFHIGRRLKLFDGSTLYGTIHDVSDTTVTVRLDSGALTSSLSSVAVAAVGQANCSLPDMAFRHQNVIINGDMDIWQRSATFAMSAGANGSLYTADRWAILKSSVAAVSIARDTSVPDATVAGAKLNHSLKITVVSADTAIAAGEFLGLIQAVEGWNWRHLAQRPCHVSFCCSTNKTGVYALSLCNTNGDRSCVLPFTVSTASSWQRFSLPFPASPSAGTWDYSFGVGVVARFALAAGTTRQGGSGNYTAADILATSNQVNFLASVGNTFAITGVRFHPGQHPVPMEVTQYEDELLRCQRYYQEIKGLFYVFYEILGNGFALPVPFRQIMRTTPTVVDAGTYSSTNQTGTNAFASINDTMGYVSGGLNSATGAASFEQKTPAKLDAEL